MTQRIIGRFNSTAEYPNFNQDDSSNPQKFGLCPDKTKQLIEIVIVILK